MIGYKSAIAKAHFEGVAKLFSMGQPRTPAGNPNGGEWMPQTAVVGQFPLSQGTLREAYMAGKRNHVIPGYRAMSSNQKDQAGAEWRRGKKHRSTGDKAAAIGGFD